MALRLRGANGFSGLSRFWVWSRQPGGSGCRIYFILAAQPSRLWPRVRHVQELQSPSLFLPNNNSIISIVLIITLVIIKIIIVMVALVIMVMVIIIVIIVVICTSSLHA